MARPKKQSLEEMVESPRVAAGNTRALIGQHQDLIQRARAMGYSWPEVAAGLSETAGRPITGAALQKAWSRMHGKTKARRPAFGGAARPAAPRQDTTATAKAKPAGGGFVDATIE